MPGIQPYVGRGSKPGRLAAAARGPGGRLSPVAGIPGPDRELHGHRGDLEQPGAVGADGGRDHSETLQRPALLVELDHRAVPFSATRVPPSSSSGNVQRASLSIRATARAVTNGARRRPGTLRPGRGGRCTLSSPSSATVATATSCGAASAPRGGRPGRDGRSASARPGRPAPEPTSTMVAPSGNASWTTAQLSTCRSHSRGTSRGPIRPWLTPVSARIPANRSASAEPVAEDRGRSSRSRRQFCRRLRGVPRRPGLAPGHSWLFHVKRAVAHAGRMTT